MAKVKQTNISLDEKSQNQLEIIRKITMLDKSKVVRLSINKLYDAIKDSKYDLSKLEIK